MLFRATTNGLTASVTPLDPPGAAAVDASRCAGARTTRWPPRASLGQAEQHLTSRRPCASSASYCRLRPNRRTRTSSRPWHSSNSEPTPRLAGEFAWQERRAPPAQDCCSIVKGPRRRRDWCRRNRVARARKRTWLLRRRHGSGRGAAALALRQAEARSLSVQSALVKPLRVEVSSLGPRRACGVAGCLREVRRSPAASSAGMGVSCCVVVRAGAQPYLGPRSGLVPDRRHDV